MIPTGGRRERGIEVILLQGRLVERESVMLALPSNDGKAGKGEVDWVVAD